MTCSYTTDSNKRYRVIDELHLTPETFIGEKFIEESKKLYFSFVNEFRYTLDLGHVETIGSVYQSAKDRGIFEFAAGIRKTFYGMDMHFYGVTYLWDMCMESCIYCPAALQNRKKTKYKPLSLSIDEAVKDVLYIMKDGHRHLCVLAGEYPAKYPAKILAGYIAAFDQLGLKEIILNVEPPADESDYQLWRNAAKNTALQFRVFQETYQRDTYTKIHPKTKFGRKYNYDFRYQSQEMALKYGFDEVGIGVLFGLHRYPLEEIDSLKAHAEELKYKTGKNPARVCLPSAKHLENIEVSIPYTVTGHKARQKLPLYWQLSEILYALSRLAMPSVNIVSSERDPSELLAILDLYATCTTLNVHPGVGDNIRYHEKIEFEDTHFEQAPSYSRNPKTSIHAFKARGYRPIIALGD